MGSEGAVRLEAGAHRLGILAGLLALEVRTEGVGHTRHEHIAHDHIDDLDLIALGGHGRTVVGRSEVHDASAQTEVSLEEAIVEDQASVDATMCACATRDLGAHVVQIEVPREGLRAVEEERTVEACAIGESLV